jgi:hypothetical protein
MMSPGTTDKTADLHYDLPSYNDWRAHCAVSRTLSSNYPTNHHNALSPNRRPDPAPISPNCREPITNSKRSRNNLTDFSVLYFSPLCLPVDTPTVATTSSEYRSSICVCFSANSKLIPGNVSKPRRATTFESRLVPFLGI